MGSGPNCQYLKPALTDACAILQAQAAPTSQRFLFCSLTLTPSLPFCSLLHLSFYHKYSSKSGRNCLLSPPLLSGYNGSPDTHFSRKTMLLIIWSGGVRYSCLFQSFAVSLLFASCTHYFLSRTGGVRSLLNSSIHRSPRFPLRNLRSLVMFAVSSLVFAAMDTTLC